MLKVLGGKEIKVYWTFEAFDLSLHILAESVHFVAAILVVVSCFMELSCFQ